LRQKLFNKKDYREVCENCFFGVLSPEKNCVFCSQTGIVKNEYSCKKYKYDPLKRIPKRPKKLPSYNENDFKL